MMKYVVYYKKASSNIYRGYPEFVSGADVRKEWEAIELAARSGRRYLAHETHDEYTAAFSSAGMIGKDEAVQRRWIERRVADLQAKAIANAPTVLAPNSLDHSSAKPGDIVRDQFGRSRPVPQVELEVFRKKPISSDAAMDAVRDFCKGGGGNIPRGS